MGRAKTTKATLLGLVAASALAMGCDEPRITYPDVLEAPVSLLAADGEVCLPPVFAEDATIDVGPMPRCAEEGEGFGLVINQRSHKVSVVALGQQEPRVVNLDSRRPGLTGIDVGPSPVDGAVTDGGTAAVVANQGDRTLTGIDLWTLRPLEETVELEGSPVAIEAAEDADGEPVVVVLTRQPDQLQIRGGLSCERPDDGIDRRDYLPDENCEWSEVDVQTLDLAGRPADFALSHEPGEAWVIYRDVSILSRVALDERGLGDEASCLGDEAAPPCETDRISWVDDEEDNGPVQWGANQVDVDPLGLFVYVLDRANSEVILFDRGRVELIDAAQAAEPPTAPFRVRPGVPVSTASLAMSADVERDILDEQARHVQYRIGARLADNSGQLYMMGAIDLECIYDGEAPLDEETFLFDAQRRADSDEAACLSTPSFPLGGNPDEQDDEELEQFRYFDVDGAQIGITPIFGLRDATATDGQVRGRAQCEQPDELLQAMRDAADDTTVMGCGSPLMPQPVAPEVPDDLDTYADAQRLDLATYAEAWFDEAGQPEIVRSVHDLRLLNEDWTITYEGRIPGPGEQARGLVDLDDDGHFRSGGSDFCAAGVEVGDRLTIRTSPGNVAGCEVYEGPAEFRTYEIVEVGPFGVDLAVLDEEDRVDVLPTRECFDRGLSYEIRARDAWTVVGSSSGMSSPWERDGDECVLRDQADTGLLEGRAQTGELYRGPYFQFRLREGVVDPVQGLSFTLRVERNFSRVSERFNPDGALVLPRQVAFLPDLGAGRWLSVVDAGGDYIFLRNLTTGDESRFLR